MLQGLGPFRGVLDPEVRSENGAVNHFPHSGRSSGLVPGYSGTLVQAVRKRALDVRTGECIVELDGHAAHIVLDVTQELQLPMTLHFDDHELLAGCEVGSAVAWGSLALQRSADLVIPGDA